MVLSEAAIDSFCSILHVVIILTRVDFLPAYEAQDVIEGRGEEGTEQRADPVDPVISRECAVDYIWSQGTRRVQGSSGIIVTWNGVLGELV